MIRTEVAGGDRVTRIGRRTVMIMSDAREVPVINRAMPMLDRGAR